MNRTDRLHALRDALERAGSPGMTAAALADEFEISVRTVKRDLRSLQQSGLPVVAQPGPGGGYALDTAATLPPVTFTQSQAVALAVAFSALPSDGPFSVEARAAVDRVLDTLGPEARARVEKLAAVARDRGWDVAR